LKWKVDFNAEGTEDTEKSGEEFTPYNRQLIADSSELAGGM
jgi:hypothetical protein